MNRTISIPSEVEYHRVLAGEKRRIGRGILAIVLLIGGMLVFNVLFTVAAALVNGPIEADGRAAYTPLFHAAGLASVALLIPWSMLIQRWLYGVRGASLHSVLSRFRFDIFGRALLVILPVWVAVTAALYWSPLPQASWAYADVIWFLAATLLLTPLQGAGEEYGFRGLIFRIVGGWTRRPRAGLIVGILVSSVLFAVVHFSTDPVLNLNYLIFAAGIALIVWRTGGLEIAVVLHAGFNTLNFLFDAALGIDITEAYDRSAGVGTVLTILPAAVVIVAVLVVWVRTRRTGPALTPSMLEHSAGIATDAPQGRVETPEETAARIG
ncbi:MULTISPECIES: CPBP family intramembrane glutamic endopeptidase [unclassified Salinibacterium]|uniref:CPBP family intramembrane glutamic endopeptidase n=1 Tax=unclassified Salinibacterium TaxID=2632331 RepID=UPI00197F957A|nr:MULTISPECIES: type II CAAX endopeptidase family protein [unclassified Salinibacterium]